MNKNLKNGLFMLVAGALATSCADYNDLGGFKADPDPTYEEAYTDLGPVKSYLDTEKYPNMSIGTTLKVADFNKQELLHAAAMTNFTSVAFGTDLMSGKIVNEKGIMNFLDMMDLLAHAEDINANVYGSPIVANANQADGWLKYLTSPIEIQVDPIVDKYVDYTTMDEFTGTHVGDKVPTIVKDYDGPGVNALKVPKNSKAYIVEGFDIDPLGEYTITFTAKVDKEVSIMCTFAGSRIMEDEKNGKKFVIKPGKWQKVTIETTPPDGATDGYLMTEGNRNSEIYIKDVKVVHNPDNHRPQTDEEIKDTISYALNTWCETLMKYNEGRIKSFDLIDEPIDTKVLEGVTYEGEPVFDLKHSTETIYWQDKLGSENYAPIVSKLASAAFEKHGGNLSELKFFISESNLDNAKKLKSLKYWIEKWDAKGAKIDGINAKLNLTYSEDEAKQTANEATVVTLLENLAATGKLIRISNFDIKYQDADGASVTPVQITPEQRQKLADYYAFVIRNYMNKIPNEQQAGICKTNMVDTTSDPVGLWSENKDTKNWSRTATYKAFCDALSGK